MDEQARAIGATTGDATVVTGIVVSTPPGTALGAPIVLPEEMHPARRYLLSLKEDTTRPPTEHALNLIARLFGFPNLDMCPWHLMRFTHVDWVRSQLATGFIRPADPSAPPTSKRPRGRPRRDQDAAPPDNAPPGAFVKLAPSNARKHMAALRMVLHYTWKLGYMTHEEFARAVDVKPIPGESARASTGRAITAGELLALITAAARDLGPDGARDVAIFSLGYGLGLRRGDLITIRLADYDPAQATLRLIGKGAKEAVLPVEGQARSALDEWIAIRGSEPGPMFYRVRKGGQVLERETKKRLSSQAINDIVRRRAQEAGVKPFTPHDLRRTFAGDMLDQGADIVTVQYIMRHSDPKTTAQYDRRPDNVRRAAVGRLHIPAVPLARKTK